MRLSKCVLFYIFASKASISYAWWSVDDSCDNKNKSLQYKDFVTEGTKDAFDLAYAGADALTDIREFYSKLDQSNPTPTQQARIDLFKYLFSDADASKDDDEIFELVSYTFTTIISFLQPYNNDPIPKPSGPPFDRYGFIVYCNYARFKEGRSCGGSNHKDLACDPDVNADIEMNDKYRSCKNSTDPSIAAWIAHDSKDSKSPAQIQLCPWFLAESNNRPYKYLKDIIGPKAFLSRVYDWGLAMEEDRTMMDAAYTFGHSMIHELSHAIAKSTEDIDGKQSYGWKNCVRLSKKGGAAANADNYAYFALGAKLINPGGNAMSQRPMEDGSIQMLPDSRKEEKREYHQEYPHSTYETKPGAVKPTSRLSISSLDIPTLTSSAKVEATRVSTDDPRGLNHNSRDDTTCSPLSTAKPSNTLPSDGYSLSPSSPQQTHLKRQPQLKEHHPPPSTATPIYDNLLWDGNKEWYYLRELILDDLSTATWPTVTWTATKTQTASSHLASPTNVDLGILTCGSPDPDTIKNPIIKDAPLFKRTDQGNPQYWMSLGEPGQSGLIDGVSVFCNLLSKLGIKVEPRRSNGVELSYNKNIYDPIFFGIEWDDKELNSCPDLDFSGKSKEAMKVCKERFDTVIHKCDTSSNNHHWWKQGGTFFRDCITWRVYRDKWDANEEIPTEDSYRPKKKCRTSEDCDCGFGKGWGGAEVCADMEEFSDLGWCTCWDRFSFEEATDGDDQ